MSEKLKNCMSDVRGCGCWGSSDLGDGDPACSCGYCLLP